MAGQVLTAIIVHSLVYPDDVESRHPSTANSVTETHPCLLSGLLESTILDGSMRDKTMGLVTDNKSQLTYFPAEGITRLS